MEQRCEWANADPLLTVYHDTEWGVPLFDERRLFEFLVLDAMQAGLSWLTILKKRDNFRKAFADYDPAKVARYDRRNIARLLQNPGIIRNRLKIESAVANARVFLRLQGELGSFSDYIWSFVNGKPIVNSWKTMRQIPPQTPLSGKMSKDLQQRGFRFVGPTICYAFMQAAGLVNDHVIDCFRHREVQQKARRR